MRWPHYRNIKVMVNANAMAYAIFLPNACNNVKLSYQVTPRSGYFPGIFR